MRKQTELLQSRTRVKARYALIPLEGVPYSRLPEWPAARVQILAAPTLGAAFTEYRLELDAGAAGEHRGDGEIEHFVFVLSGDARLTLTGGRGVVGFTGDASSRNTALGPRTLGAGGYALIPPSYGYRLEAAGDTTLLLLRKRYETAPGIEEFAPVIADEGDVAGEVYMGDEGALLQTLIPDELAFDMAMNIFTFEMGHSLPVTETHVMEHGLYVLAGKGLYYLDDTWMEVEASDFIWMGPFCPQSYYATGPTATRYLYYKNVNREIPLAEH